MAGMFYTLQEAAEKLKKTQEEIKQMIEQGKLRGFRDGSSFFLKIDEIEAFASQESTSEVPEEPLSEEAAAVFENESAPEPALVEQEPSQPEGQEMPSPEFNEEETEMPKLEETEPQVPEEEFDMAAMEELVQEIPAAESVTVTEVPAVKPKKAAKKPRSRAKPKAKRAVKPQRLSFGQWLLFNLSEDSPAAIFVLVLIFCLVLSGLAALGYGLYFLHSNL